MATISHTWYGDKTVLHFRYTHCCYGHVLLTTRYIDPRTNPDGRNRIAFHGDVLNTAARLEKKCNEYNEKLIVSQHVVDQVSSNTNFNFKFLSDLALKGKSENIKYYSVIPVLMEV